MKRIFIGLIIGILFSVLLFVWGWRTVEKTYLVPKQTADQEFCDQLKTCRKCNREYKCLKNECDSNDNFKASCQKIEDTWKSMPIGLTPEIFISSLCGIDDTFYNKNCLEKQSDLKLEFNLALARIPYNIGISSIIGIYNLNLFGKIILFIPPLLGLFFGWVAYLFYKKGKVIK